MENRKKVLVIHGPNLNLLGERETSVYGKTTMADIDAELVALGSTIGLDVESYQSNVEGEMVNRIQDARGKFSAIIINPGGYTHYSVAIRDAIAAVSTPVVEVHISNILTRESFRHESLIGPVCKGSIMGFGLDSYRLGIESFLKPENIL